MLVRNPQALPDSDRNSPLWCGKKAHYWVIGAIKKKQKNPTPNSCISLCIEIRFKHVGSVQPGHIYTALYR